MRTAEFAGARSRIGLEPSWKEALAEELAAPYMQELRAFLLRQKQQGKTVLPPGDEIFAALNLSHLDRVKVVIVGQDPYHGLGQAHGLSFSVKPGVSIPPSLANIYRELHNDLGIAPAPHGYLRSWAEQGVLLLNAILTVALGEAASHQNQGWERFTSKILAVINQRRDHVAFVLWGNYAQRKGEGIDRHKHLVLTAPHPSPLSAHRGFLGTKPFSQINRYLLANNLEPICWQLPPLSRASSVANPSKLPYYKPTQDFADTGAH